MVFQLKISKPTYNALTETDPRNLVFDASLNHLKTVSYGSFEREVNSGYEEDYVTVSITHGLGIKPMVIGYFRDTATNNWKITMTQIAPVIPCRSQFNVEVYVDSTYVKFRIQNYSGSTKTIEVQYEIFYEGI